MTFILRVAGPRMGVVETLNILSAVGNVFALVFSDHMIDDLYAFTEKPMQQALVFLRQGGVLNAVIAGETDDQLGYMGL